MYFNELKNYLEDDSLIDFLDLWGSDNGFKPTNNFYVPEHISLSDWKIAYDIREYNLIENKVDATKNNLENGIILSPVIFDDEFGLYLNPHALIDGSPVFITTKKYVLNKDSKLLKSYNFSSQLELQRAAHILKKPAYFIQLISKENKIVSDYSVKNNNKIHDAIKWRKKVISEGKLWNCYKYNEIGLAPNMNLQRNTPWNDVKKTLAYERGELTLLWSITFKQRNEAWARGIYSLSQLFTPLGRKTIENLVNLTKMKTIDNILSVNNPNHSLSITPRRWITVPSAKYIVSIDYETIHNFQFHDKPPWIFLVGVVILNTKSKNITHLQWTLPNLHPDHQNEMLHNFINAIPNDHVLLHWSNIEQNLLNKWIGKQPQLKWFDLLDYFRKNNIGIRGAYNFGLKDIATSLYNLNCIPKCIWDKNDIHSGFHAMKTAINHYTKSANPDDMERIKKYNLVDCKVLLEIYKYIKTRSTSYC